MLSGLVISLGVILSDDESFDGDRGSPALPYKNIGEVGTGEYTGDANIFSISQISAGSWIDPMFIKLSVIF